MVSLSFTIRRRDRYTRANRPRDYASFAVRSCKLIVDIERSVVSLLALGLLYSALMVYHLRSCSNRNLIVSLYLRRKREILSRRVLKTKEPCSSIGGSRNHVACVCMFQRSRATDVMEDGRAIRPLRPQSVSACRYQYVTSMRQELERIHRSLILWNHIKASTNRPQCGL